MVVLTSRLCMALIIKKKVSPLVGLFLKQQYSLDMQNQLQRDGMIVFLVLHAVGEDTFVIVSVNIAAGSLWYIPLLASSFLYNITVK